MPKREDKPAQYIDGWMAHKNNLMRTRNPYDIMTQFASHELWTEGWVGRQYAIRNKTPTDLDDYVPRVDV